MKAFTRNLLLASVSALFVTGVHAHAPTAQPQCAQVICLSPADGTPAPSACRSIRQVYFNIRVFDPKYDPAKTSRLRHRYISMCKTARSQDLTKITQKYGYLFADPIAY